MTYKELQYRQSWTLEQKIDHSAGVVSVFMEKMNGKLNNHPPGRNDKANH